MKYRHKPIEVEAIQWTGDNWYDVKKFAKFCILENIGLTLNLISGFNDTPVYVTDYLVKVNDKPWIVKKTQSDFLSNYEPISEPIKHEQNGGC